MQESMLRHLLQSFPLLRSNFLTGQIKAFLLVMTGQIRTFLLVMNFYFTFGKSRCFNDHASYANKSFISSYSHSY